MLGGQGNLSVSLLNQSEGILGIIENVFCVRVTIYQCKLNAIMRESEKRRSSTLRAMLEDRYGETMSMKEVESKGIVYRV